MGVSELFCWKHQPAAAGNRVDETDQTEQCGKICREAKTIRPRGLKSCEELQSWVIILDSTLQWTAFIAPTEIRFIIHLNKLWLKYFLHLLSSDLVGYCVLDHSHGRELLPLSPRACDSSLDPLGHLLPPGERPKRTGADYRALWKTAIHQQILLLRMEKENQRLEGELLVVTIVHINNRPRTYPSLGHRYEEDDV